MKYKYTYKKRHFLNWLLIITLPFFLWACPTPPEFEEVPNISFEKVEFFDNSGDDPRASDSLRITINFEDGNGDLGLSSNDIYEPYNEFYVFVNDDGSPVFIGDDPELPAYNPLDYYIIAAEDSVIFNGFLLTGDTIYIDQNENYYNIFVDFYYDRGNGWEEFKWEEEPYYQVFDGRFPRLNTEEYERPLNGSLTYNMISAGFKTIFRNYPMKLEIQIQDRALNKSNQIETEPFTLQ